MKVRVDKKACVGDMICVQICPDIFVMDEYVAVVKMEDVPAELLEDVRKASDACPTQAITLV